MTGPKPAWGGVVSLLAFFALATAADGQTGNPAGLSADYSGLTEGLDTEGLKRFEWVSRLAETTGRAGIRIDQMQYCLTDDKSKIEVCEEVDPVLIFHADYLPPDSALESPDEITITRSMETDTWTVTRRYIGTDDFGNGVSGEFSFDIVLGNLPVGD
jgi:hypothetical protein